MIDKKIASIHNMVAQAPQQAPQQEQPMTFAQACALVSRNLTAMHVLRTNYTQSGHGVFANIPKAFEIIREHLDQNEVSKQNQNIILFGLIDFGKGAVNSSTDRLQEERRQVVFDSPACLPIMGEHNDPKPIANLEPGEESFITRPSRWTNDYKEFLDHLIQNPQNYSYGAHPFKNSYAPYLDQLLGLGFL